jgi:hypothetical protein
LVIPGLGRRPRAEDDLPAGSRHATIAITRTAILGLACVSIKIKRTAEGGKMDVPGWGLIALLVLFVFSIPGTFLRVNTAEVAIITRFGKFLRVAEPGLNWK